MDLKDRIRTDFSRRIELLEGVSMEVAVTEYDDGTKCFKAQYRALSEEVKFSDIHCLKLDKTSTFDEAVKNLERICRYDAQSGGLDASGFELFTTGVSFNLTLAINRFVCYYNRVMDRLITDFSSNGILSAYKNMLPMVDRMLVMDYCKMRIETLNYGTSVVKDRDTHLRVRLANQEFSIYRMAFENMDQTICAVMHSIAEPFAHTFVASARSTNPGWLFDHCEHEVVDDKPEYVWIAYPIFFEFPSIFSKNNRTNTQCNTLGDFDEKGLLKQLKANLLEDQGSTMTMADGGFRTGRVQPASAKWIFRYRTWDTVVNATNDINPVTHVNTRVLNGISSSSLALPDHTFLYTWEDPQSTISTLNNNVNLRKGTDKKPVNVNWKSTIRIDACAANVRLKFPIEFKGVVDKKLINNQTTVRITHIKNSALYPLQQGFAAANYDSGLARFQNGQRYLKDVLVLDQAKLTFIPIYCYRNLVASVPSLETLSRQIKEESSFEAQFSWGSREQELRARQAQNFNGSLGSYLVNNTLKKLNPVNPSGLWLNRVLAGFLVVPQFLIELALTDVTETDATEEPDWHSAEAENNPNLRLKIARRLLSEFFKSGNVNCEHLSAYFPVLKYSHGSSFTETDVINTLDVRSNDRELVNKAVEYFTSTEPVDWEAAANALSESTLKDDLAKFFTTDSPSVVVETNNVPLTTFQQARYIKDLLNRSDAEQYGIEDTLDDDESDSTSTLL